MMKFSKVPAVLFLLMLVLSMAQPESAKYLPDKPGKWSYLSNIKTPGAEIAALNKNLAILAAWFHQNVPMLFNPKGYDLDTRVYESWDDHYKMSKRNYALRASMEFNFQLFFSTGGKWTVEPPHYSFSIKSTGFGAGFCTFKNVEDDVINARGIGRAVVKFNLACWDRSLPVTTVQYMSWDYRPETELELEKFKSRNGGLADYVGMLTVCRLRNWEF